MILHLDQRKPPIRSVGRNKSHQPDFFLATVLEVSSHKIPLRSTSTLQSTLFLEIHDQNINLIVLGISIGTDAFIRSHMIPETFRYIMSLDMEILGFIYSVKQVLHEVDESSFVEGILKSIRDYSSCCLFIH